MDCEAVVPTQKPRVPEPDALVMEAQEMGGLGENDDERLEALRKLIGEEAHIRVEVLDPEKPNSVRVTEVWPVVMPVPARWADEEGELD